MLIPQFSLRWLLGLTAVCAVVFSILGLAVRGSRWAGAVSVGIGSLVVLMVVYGLVFALVWVFSVASSSLGRRGTGSAGSPFGAESSGVGPAATPKEAPAPAILLEGSPFGPEGPEGIT